MGAWQASCVSAARSLSYNGRLYICTYIGQTQCALPLPPQ